MRYLFFRLQEWDEKDEKKKKKNYTVFSAITLFYLYTALDKNRVVTEPNYSRATRHSAR